MSGGCRITVSLDELHRAWDERNQARKERDDLAKQIAAVRDLAAVAAPGTLNAQSVLDLLAVTAPSNGSAEPTRSTCQS